ncbi:MAG: hypothetical protein NUV91_08040 [Candidatus Omnitrophica bacterium]|nr:hypothetical protein [Candidatus Omnitrophota bacterium]
MDQKILSIELADRCIRYLYLEKEQNSYKIIRSGQSQISFSYSESGALTKAIQSLLENEKIHPQAISILLSSQDVLIGQVVLPENSARNNEQAIVTEEIRKISSKDPHDLEIVFCSYPINDESTRIVFSAVSKSFLKWIDEEVSRLKIPLKGLDVSPCHLKDALPGSSPAFSDTMAYLVIQEEKSFLAVIQAGAYRLFYLSTVGMSLLSSGSSEKSPKDLYVQWADELKRVLDAFLAKNPAIAIPGVGMIWDKAILSDLDQRLAKSLGIEVDVLYLKKFKDVKITEESQMNPVFVPLLSMMLGYWRGSKSDFSFYRFVKSSQDQKAFPMIIVISFLTILFAAWVLGTIFLNRRSHKIFYQQEIKAIQSQMDILEKDQQQSLDEYRQSVIDRDHLGQQLSSMAPLEKMAWGEMFDGIRSQLLDGMRLEDIKVNSEGKVFVHVRAVSLTGIESWVESFKSLSWVNEVALEPVKELEDEEKKSWLIGMMLTPMKE